MNYLIKNATIVNEGTFFLGNALIENGKISKVSKEPIETDAEVIDGTGKHLLPGIIDSHVHFREPGLTEKGDIATESKAAVHGGVTSYMEMPNTLPNATSLSLLEEKYAIAAEKSYANYSFFLGATASNLADIQKLDLKQNCGVKVFDGGAHGDLLVDDPKELEKIFAAFKGHISMHCESERIIAANLEKAQTQHGNDIPMDHHPSIRSEEACFEASAIAVKLAQEHNAKLNVVHVTTEKELSLFQKGSVADKNITAEVCAHHLWFTDADYAQLGSKIKWNPAVKTKQDRDALLQGLLDTKLDVVSTDHAPHTSKEKAHAYVDCPSGAPLIQHSLVMMLEFVKQGTLTIEQVVEKMCHNQALLFNIKERGFIKEGYAADLVLVDLNKPWTVSQENILSKCGWSPLEGQQFSSSVTHTFVNGTLVVNDGAFMDTIASSRLEFER